MMTGAFKTVSLALCVSLLVAPIPASAQLGGLGRKMLSGGAQAGASARMPVPFWPMRCFPPRMMTASALIAQTLTNSRIWRRAAQIVR
jgi:hypothetical protein